MLVRVEGENLLFEQLSLSAKLTEGIRTQWFYVVSYVWQSLPPPNGGSPPLEGLAFGKGKERGNGKCFPCHSENMGVVR